MKRSIVKLIVFILLSQVSMAQQKEISPVKEVPKPYLTDTKKLEIKRYTDSLSRTVMRGMGTHRGANAFQTEKAIMRTIFNLDSIDYTAGFLMAQVQANEKKYDSAIYYLSRVIRFNPGLTRYYDFRAALWLIKSDKAKAGADYQKIIDLLQARIQSGDTPAAARVAYFAQIATTNVMMGKFNTQASLDYYNDHVRKLNLSPEMEKPIRLNRAMVVSFNRQRQIDMYARGVL